MAACNIKQLRILSTVLLAFAIAQAGLGSGFLDDSQAAADRPRHQRVRRAGADHPVRRLRLLLRRAGGPSWTFFLPLALVLMAGIQITLGFAGIRGGHVFWGVLYLCTVTTFCSYCWRLKPRRQPTTRPEPARSRQRPLTGRLGDVEPGVEERVQLSTGHLLGQRDELRGGHRLAPLGLAPSASGSGLEVAVPTFWRRASRVSPPRV